MINQTIPLPVGGGSATLHTYLHENSDQIDPGRKRPLVVICPGGAYRHTSDREAEPVAVALNARGFHAAVLRYSVAPARYPQALLELAAAVAHVRDNAADWHVDENAVVVMGFSAGGHLAGSLGVFWREAFLSRTLGRDSDAFRPDGMLLCYPVVTAGCYRHQGSVDNLLGPEPDPALLERFSLERQVSAHTPPAFLWHTDADESVPVENSLLLATALRAHRVPLELHLFPRGPHGLSLATEETAAAARTDHIAPDCAVWIDLAATWLRRLRR